MLHHLSCAYYVLWTFAKYVQILFKSISFDPFAGWHCLAKCVHGHNKHYHHNHHHHHHCDHCLAKCVHVIKTGCRPLSFSLSCVLLAHLYSRTDQQPSRNKKLHRSKNRANPAFNAWALVGPPTAGLASHWPTPSCDSGPNRPFCQLPSFSANYSSREARIGVSARPKLSH